MKSLSDNATIAIVVFFVLLAVLGATAGVTFNGYQNNLKEQKLATVCIENGGNWTIVNDRSLSKGCVK